jgi:hypothetical protein
MKLGKSLVELAQEVMRQNDTKKDYIADTSALTMLAAPEKPIVMSGFNGAALGVRPAAHAQIGQHAGIPKAYYDRMLGEAPELLASNVNHWLKTQPEKRMVRTLDGEVRGFLSSRYRAMDNFDLLQAVLPVLHGRKVEFKSCEVTEKHLYLKVIFPELRTEIPGSKQVGDIVEAGLSIRNSEIGFSSFAVEPFFHRLVCTNGMISNYAQRKYHVGKRIDSVDAVEEILRDETRDMRDRAFWMQIQDVIGSAINRDVMMAHVQKFSEAAGIKIESDPVKVVEQTRKAFALSEAQGVNILQHLIADGDLSKWGLANAITRTAQDQTDYEDATALERLGGKIIELGARDWTSLVKVA